MEHHIDLGDLHLYLDVSRQVRRVCSPWRSRTTTGACLTALFPIVKEQLNQKLVELTGIEPVTLAPQAPRSPN